MPNFRFKLSTLLIAVAAVAACLVLIPIGFSRLTGFDTAMQAEFRQIAIGDSRVDLLADMGMPKSSGAEFSRELATYRTDVAESDISRTREFLVWRNGMNWYYCIGLDADDKIVFKIEGHS